MLSKNHYTVSAVADSLELERSKREDINGYIHDVLARELAYEIVDNFPTEVTLMPEYRTAALEGSALAPFVTPHMLPPAERHSLDIYIFTESQLDDLIARVKRLTLFDMAANKALGNLSEKVAN